VTLDREEPQVVEEAPAVKPRLSLVVVLSMLLGVLLTVGVVGAILHFEKSKASQVEMASVREEIRVKSLALEEMRMQLEALSKQMNVLKEYSIARSGSANGKDGKVGSVSSSADAATNATAVPSATEKNGLPEISVKAKKSKPKPDSQNCELVGKSPDEQAATLQRCVSLIDPPKEKTR